MWLVSNHWVYLAAIQFYSGFMWAGFNLAAANFMFDAVSAPKRARCAAYQALVNGAFVCAGTLLGGFLAGNVASPLPALPWLPNPASPLLFLFFLSGIVRVFAAAYFLPRVREVREVERIRHRELVFRVAQIRALSGISFSMLGERYTRALRLLPKKKNGKRGPKGRD
jgi:MFS family permease